MNPTTHFYFLALSLLSVCLNACQNKTESEQGYIEAELTYISSSVSGYLQKIFNDQGTSIEAHHPLYQLDHHPEQYEEEAQRAERNEAKAAVEAAHAQLKLAVLELARKTKLFEKKFLSKEEYDRAITDHDSASALLQEKESTLSATEARLKNATWDTSQKIMKAPQAGFIYDVYYRVGEYVPKGQPVLSLLSPDNIKIIFYVKQPIISSLQLNDLVHIKDAQGKTAKARIHYISPFAEFTPPLLFSNDTNSKLSFRIEARFVEKKNLHFHPGQPVTVVYTPHVA